ncbi:MAG: divalent-cation tolerance protein CutA [Gemmatimonadota bacterium]
MECVQVTTTLPSREAADRLAEELVGARLAACAQVVGPVASTYRWEGAVERAEEWYCHFKTTRARLGALADAIRARHSYELPEIVAVSLDGSEDYLRWIAENVG